MTKQDAEKEAKESWGENAYVKTVISDSSDKVTYIVGSTTLHGMPQRIEGQGDSWDKAFTDAIVNFLVEEGFIKKVKMQ